MAMGNVEAPAPRPETENEPFSLSKIIRKLGFGEDKKETPLEAQQLEKEVAEVEGKAIQNTHDLGREVYLQRSAVPPQKPNGAQTQVPAVETKAVGTDNENVDSLIADIRAAGAKEEEGVDEITTPLPQQKPDRSKSQVAEMQGPPELYGPPLPPTSEPAEPVQPIMAGGAISVPTFASGVSDDGGTLQEAGQTEKSEELVVDESVNESEQKVSLIREGQTVAIDSDIQYRYDAIDIPGFDIQDPSIDHLITLIEPLSSDNMDFATFLKTEDNTFGFTVAQILSGNPTVDGYGGPTTSKFLTEYQRKRGVLADGQLGPTTITAMINDLKSKQENIS
ncbi:peptidoglycan-binding protein [Candidatus Gracilibacteria bacterium]|nr:peptidoglycan-binding protein [Candidatus Gracilibacteria bacterium]